MLKKLGLVIPLLFFFTVLYADNECLVPLDAYTATSIPNPDCDLFEGFYLGAGYGYRWRNQDLTVNGVTPTELSTDSKFSILTRYTAGYQYTSCGGFYIAAELGYEYRSLEKHSTYRDNISNVTFTDPSATIEVLRPSEVNIFVTAQNAGTLDLLPGFLVTPRTLLYLRLGGEYASWRWKREFYFPQVVFLGAGVTQAITAIKVTNSESRDLVDYRAGIGIARALSEHVALNFNYVHIFGNREVFKPTTLVLPSVPTGSTGIVFTTAALTGDNRINTNANEIFMGATFTF